jgi:hypothetical protein
LKKLMPFHLSFIWYRVTVDRHEPNLKICQITKITNITEICSVPSEIKRSDRQTSPFCQMKLKQKKTPRPQSASEVCRPSDSRLSAKVVSTFADRGCHVVSAADPHGRVLGFLDRSRCFFFQAAPHLYSRGWVDPFPDPLLLRKSGSAGNRTRSSGSVARNSAH